MQRFVYVLTILLACSIHGQAQSVDELIMRAYVKFNDKDYHAAANDIDELVQLKKAESNELAWHVRGFVYKDIFIHEHKGNPESEARTVAVFSLLKSVELDKQKALLENNVKALNFLAASFFNDASDIIEERDPATIDKAEVFFEEYKRIVLLIDDTVDMKPKTIRFYLAMATAHRKIYEADRDANTAHYDLANKYYSAVLDLDPDSFSANYSKAVLYYNSAAYKLERLSELEMFDMIKVQGESMRTIQFALPFMMRAYEVNPERIEAVKGLKYILFNLHDYEKSDFFDEEYHRLEQEQK